MNKETLSIVYRLLLTNLMMPNPSESHFTNYIYTAMTEVLTEDVELYEKAVAMLLDFERRFQMDISVAEKQVFARKHGLTTKVMARFKEREPKLTKQEPFPRKRAKYEFVDWMVIEAEINSLKFDVYMLCKQFFASHNITPEKLMYSPLE